MKVVRYYVPNSYDNYNHLLIDPDSMRAMVIDPFSKTQTLEMVAAFGATLDAIYLTHEHGDHIRAAGPLAKHFNLPIYGNAKIPLVTQPVKDGDEVSVGNQTVVCWETPGHTFLHTCLYGSDEDGIPFLITADTVFNAGVGNTHSGDTEVLFQSIDKIKDLLADHARIYPAHDYMENNLRFARSLEPGNKAIDLWLEKVKQTDAESRPVTEWSDELTFNPFLRLDSAELKQSVSERLSRQLPTDLEVFSSLRKLRDEW
ncbi:hydroxyacylglutathione hydrolase [Gynuella sunshinyii]|uniref:hydroxyacylglutathione hydrolase n=1 Tax=Gynuella sunshinyii YC6258 TaxID=1445510 RepID=A0A0C5VM84_9GAMM|nr:hydroxyacylglutathione hydrolase [Gynuella sunshinyii]AJQ95421.1 Zn-dependent hydrolase, including glyoxylase [Gynuella sunshinyii YC6258]